MPRAQLQIAGTLSLTTQPTLHVGWASGLRTVTEAWAPRYVHKHVVHPPSTATGCQRWMLEMARPSVAKA